MIRRRHLMPAERLASIARELDAIAPGAPILVTRALDRPSDWPLGWIRQQDSTPERSALMSYTETSLNALHRLTSYELHLALAENEAALGRAIDLRLKRDVARLEEDRAAMLAEMQRRPDYVSEVVAGRIEANTVNTDPAPTGYVSIEDEEADGIDDAPIAHAPRPAVRS